MAAKTEVQGHLSEKNRTCHDCGVELTDEGFYTRLVEYSRTSAASVAVCLECKKVNGKK